MKWKIFLLNEKKKEYFKDLQAFLDKEYEEYTVCPKKNDIFNAFNTEISDIKCVILGQDPYPDVNKAMGLSFSVPAGVKIPASLKNIYKEICREYGYPFPETGDLTPWAEQGVFLLNTILTYRKNDKGNNAHKKKGWEIFTDNVIKTIEKEDRPIVYMLWGNEAIKKKALITNPKHIVLESIHPSPLNQDKFVGNNHFKLCNEYLSEPIDWRL